MGNAFRKLSRCVRRRTLGHPLIYERLRPWLLGYHDESPLFRELNVHAEDVILDIGCGSGSALRYLEVFKDYHGFDVDPIVIARLRKRFPRPTVHGHLGEVHASDLSQIAPTKVLMIGILHHLDDRQACELLRMIREAGSIERIISLDPIYVASRMWNNLLCRFDSGAHVRTQSDTVRLIRESGFSICRSWHSQSGNGMAHYLEMCFV